MSLLLDGKLEEAARAFDALAVAPDAAPLADRARTLAEVSRALAARGRFVLKEPGAEPPRPARLDRRGRAELAFFATIYGIWTGVATGILADADDARAYLALALAGGAGGLTLGDPARRATRRCPRAARRPSSRPRSGARSTAVSSPRSRTRVSGEWSGATLGTGLAALGTAVLLTRERSPSSGDVALTNSGGIWGLVTGGLTLAILEDASATTAQGVLLAGADAGLLAMALVARKVDMSRGRSLLIDAGGLLGALAGASIPAFANSENGPAIGASGLAGMATGLAIATYVTRDWDEDRDEPRARARRRDGGADARAARGRRLLGGGGGEVLAPLGGVFRLTAARTLAPVSLPRDRGCALRPTPADSALTPPAAS